MDRIPYSYEEEQICFELFMSNPTRLDIEEVALMIGRTFGSVALKIQNYKYVASRRGKKGMSHISSKTFETYLKNKMKR